MTAPPVPTPPVPTPPVTAPPVTAPPVTTSTPEEGPALTTHLYALESESVRLEDFDGRGGAIESMGDDLLVVTPKGRFALVFQDGTVEYLDGSVPMNYTGLESSPMSEEPDFDSLGFRVADILLEEIVGGYTLFVTHHHFAGGCVGLRLSSTTMVRDGQRVAVLPDWRTIFDAEPCSEQPDGWQNAGSKMLTDGEEHLLVTIGNQAYGQRPVPSDLHIGKFVRIEIETGEAEVLATGIRNSQGLARDAEGNLWATDHGPQGGDELNLLREGADYGWPLASYGVGYGRVALRLIEDEDTGKHDGFLHPTFAWVPSPALSAIAVNDERHFPLWEDDLLIASLKDQSLFRVRRHGTEVQYVERIEVGYRIRDLTFMPDGRIALLSDGSQVTFLSRSARYCDEESRDRRDVYSINCESAPALIAKAKSDYEAIVSGELIISSNWDVYLSENRLSYVKEPCAEADTEAWFFLAVYPVDVNDLPDQRKPHGSDNLGFRFDRRGVIFDGICTATVALPDYDITRVSTGQYVPVEGGYNHLWEGEFLNPALRNELIAKAKSAYEAVVSGEPVIRSDWDVYFSEDTLTYVKEPCAPADVEAWFFLALYPVDVNDLPDDSKQYGFDNLDFDFYWFGEVFDGRCMATVALPEYDITRISTGQYVGVLGGTKHLWEGEFLNPALRNELIAKAKSDYEAVVSGEPAIRSDWNVYLSEDTLTYVKEPCAPADVEAMFFLALYPVDVNDLPDDSKQYGFDNLDFRFEQRGMILDGRCIAAAALPEYDIDRVSTGQYVPVEGRYNHPWEGEFRLGE